MSYERLVGLRQEGSVKTYREAFEKLSASLRYPSEELLTGAFLHGLAAEIQAELRLSSHWSLESMMDTAQLIEEKSWALISLGRGSRNWTENWARAPEAQSRSGYVSDLLKPVGNVRSATHPNRLQPDQGFGCDIPSRGSTTDGALTDCSFSTSGETLVWRLQATDRRRDAAEEEAQPLFQVRREVRPQASMSEPLSSSTATGRRRR